MYLGFTPVGTQGSANQNGTGNQANPKKEEEKAQNEGNINPGVTQSSNINSQAKKVV